MKITDCFKVRKFVLAAVLSTGLGFVSPAFGQDISYIVDSNGGGLTQVGTLGGYQLHMGSSLNTVRLVWICRSLSQR